MVSYTIPIVITRTLIGSVSRFQSP